MVFGDVIDRLEADSVCSVVAGGVAMVLRGLVRPATGLDIAVDPPRGN